MKSKIVVKIEQHFEDGSITDWSNIANDWDIPLGQNPFGGITTGKGSFIKRKLAEKVQEVLFKTECTIEV